MNEPAVSVAVVATVRPDRTSRKRTTLPESALASTFNADPRTVPKASLCVPGNKSRAGLVAVFGVEGTCDCAIVCSGTAAINIVTVKSETRLIPMLFLISADPAKSRAGQI